MMSKPTPSFKSYSSVCQTSTNTIMQLRGKLCPSRLLKPAARKDSTNIRVDCFKALSRFTQKGFVNSVGVVPSNAFSIIL